MSTPSPILRFISGVQWGLHSPNLEPCCRTVQRQHKERNETYPLAPPLPIRDPLHSRILALPPELQLCILKEVIQPWSFCLSTIAEACAKHCFEQPLLCPFHAGEGRKMAANVAHFEASNRALVCITSDVHFYLDLLQVHHELHDIAITALKDQYTGDVFWITCGKDVTPAYTKWRVPEPLQSIIRNRTRIVNLLGMAGPSVGGVKKRFPSVRTVMKHHWRYPRPLRRHYLRGTLDSAFLLRDSVGLDSILSRAWPWPYHRDMAQTHSDINIISRWHLPTSDSADNTFLCDVEIKKSSVRMVGKAVVHSRAISAESLEYWTRYRGWGLLSFRRLVAAERMVGLYALADQRYARSTLDYYSILRRQRLRQQQALVDGVWRSRYTRFILLVTILALAYFVWQCLKSA